MGPPTFARLPRIDQVQDWDVAIVGAPFDIGTSYRPGARFGPIGIRNGARTLRNWHPDLEIYPFGSQQVVDAGDIPCSTYVIDDAIATIEAAADELSQGAGGSSPWAATTPSPFRCSDPFTRGTGRWHWSISMPTSTHTTPT